jgi:myo-inositol-1(or 4)-monophosphatase
VISVKLPPQSSIMGVMTRAVVKASKGLLRDFSELENLQVSVKGSKAFVTSADLKSDQILRQELLHARPAYSLLSEESGEVAGEDGSCRWIIDPLDGTVNYMHGFPHWAISVALEKNDEIVAAITYDPIKNEMFWAEKGCGAHMNDRKIRVAGKNSLSGVLVTVATPTEPLLSRLESFSASIRKTGSATLNLAYLAAGRTDVMYPSVSPNKWDMAAGMLLLREAGGAFAAQDGRLTDNYAEVFVASNMDLLPLAAKI